MENKNGLVLFFCVFIFSAVAAHAVSNALPKTLKKPLGRDPMNVSIHRLNNGLTLYLSPNAQQPRISAWIAVRAGGAQDPEDSTGMAHYLEHMLFKGSRRLGTLDFEKEKPHLDRISALYETLFGETDSVKRAAIYKEIDEENKKAAQYASPNEITKTYRRLGIRGINAFTSNERTVYVCDMPKNRVEAWAKLESDRFAQPVFRLFQTEIETVYEEKNRSLDNAGRILGAAYDKALFGSHPYGRTVLGTIEHLKNPSLAKMYAFYNRYYVPNNMAIVLSGDFDRKKVLETLKKYFGRWEKRPLPEVAARTTPILEEERRVSVRYEAEEKAIVGWPTVAKNHPDEAALTVMDMVVDNSESGLINLRLNQAQKVKQAGSYPHFSNEGGVWQMWVIPKQGQTLEEAEKLLMKTVKALKKGDFSEEDLKAILTNFEISKKEELESNDARVQTMTDAFITRQEWDYRVDELKRLGQVTRQDVVRVANKYLGDNRVVAYREKGKPDIPSMDKPAFTKIDIDDSRESAFLADIVHTPAPSIEPKWLRPGKDYQVWSRNFGKLFVAGNPINDLFEIQFQFMRGRRHARELCAGLSLLDLSGAGRMSADEFKRELYRLGVRFSVGCDRDSSFVTLRGLDMHFEKAIELMRLRFSSPKVASGTLEKMAEIAVGKNKDHKSDPQYVLYALSEYAHKGDESDVLDELSDVELRGLKEERLIAILKDYFNYSRWVGYVGPRSTKEVLKILEEPGKKYLPAPERTPQTYVRPARPRIIFTHRDMVQSLVGLYAADETFNESNYPGYRYYSSYMGGGMSSVIFQEIRESRALAYAAGGGYSIASYKGDENRLVGSLGCQADKTVEATSLLSSLLQNLPESMDRFNETRKALSEGYRTNPIPFRDVPRILMKWWRLGMSRDPRPKRMERVEGYTLTELSRFAKRFQNAPITIYAVGNRDRVDLKGLEKMGEMVEKKVDNLFPY